MSTDLAQVALRARQGDQSAFVELYEQTHNTLYYLICRWLGTDAENEALDILQESYIEIFKTITNLKNPGAVKTWMTRIAYHQCTRFFKNKSKIVVIEESESEGLIESIQDSDEEFLPSEALENSELKKHIVELVSNLPIDQKTVTLLYYFEEMSVSEIAEIVNCPEGTVKSRLRLSRDRLRAAVEGFIQKGAQFHALAAIPILTQILQESSEDIALTAEQSKNVLIAAASAAGLTLASVEIAGGSAAASASAGTTTSGTGTASAVGGIAESLKVIVAVSGAALTVGGVIAGVIVVGNNKSAGSDVPPETTAFTSHTTEPNGSVLDEYFTKTEIEIVNPETQEVVILTTNPPETTRIDNATTQAYSEPATSEPETTQESTAGTTQESTAGTTQESTVGTTQESTAGTTQESTAGADEITEEQTTLIDPIKPEDYKSPHSKTTGNPHD